MQFRQPAPHSWAVQEARFNDGQAGGGESHPAVKLTPAANSKEKKMAYRNPMEEGPCWPYDDEEPDWMDQDDDAYHQRVDRELEGRGHED